MKKVGLYTFCGGCSFLSQSYGLLVYRGCSWASMRIESVGFRFYRRLP